MDRILALVRRYPIAAGALVAVLLTVAGWQAYQAATKPPQGAVPQAGAPHLPQGPGSQAAPGTLGTQGAPGAPAQGTSGPAPAQGTPAASGAGGAPGGSPSVEEGRPNPFAPVISPGGGGAAQPLPPVPPLAPGVEGVPPEAQFRLAGILIGAQALAIVEDRKSSYVVAPGDIFGPGADVVAIDARRGTVRIKVGGTVTTLSLQAASPPSTSPPAAPPPARRY